MKYIVLIIALISSRLFSQVDAPELRCLEVLNNGNVKLTWVPPSDPINQFHSYEIYSSVLKNGPFTPISAGLTNITTNTFVHTATVSLVQSNYYFMVTKYGSNGTGTSPHSDTLRTIFLNPTAGNVALNINFSHLRVPKLPSSASLYDINKEYPLGIWDILAATSNTTYPDTINICTVKINYQISLQDASGCQSTSNLIIGEYTDTKAPEEPYVDSISVLPNGQTILAWQVPVDKDIEKYNIQYAVGGTNQLIDQVNGRTTTSYIYTTTTANSNMIGVFVQAEDSCGSTSTVNYQIRSMFLRTSYDFCAYRTTLTWNPYQWASIKGATPETLGEYRIYYSIDGSAFNLIGRTTDTSFVHSNTSPGKNVCYFVRVINTKETITASSNRSCFFSGQTETPHFVYLKTASVKTESAVEIKVLIDNSKNFTGISVERSLNLTDYNQVGFIPFTGSDQYSILDETPNPNKLNYYYKAVIIDSCGNKRGGSNIAKTILLKVNNDEQLVFTKQLNWNEYEGFSGGVSGYYIYRIVNGDFDNALVGTTDALTTHYEDNLEEAARHGAKIEYMVQAIEGIANPHGVLESSNSNTVTVYPEGEIFIPNAFAPGGLNSTWLPVTHFIEKTDYHVNVFNRWGKKVFETNDDITAWDGANCPAGVYIYLIDYKNARGEYKQLKGTISLLR